MKKLCFLLVFLILLCGCSAELQQDPAVTTAGAASLEEYRENVIAAAEVVTYDAEPLIEYDPDREVYISLTNQDCDFYPNYWCNKGNVIIITKERYDTDEIQVKVPMQTEYTVDVNDWTDWTVVPDYASEQTGRGLQLYQYMCLQGVDWQEVGQMRSLADAALLLQFQSGSDQEARQAYGKLSEEYRALVDQTFKQYETEYRTLSKEDLPMFGVYYVEIWFPDRGDYEESVETVEFIIGGKSYNVDIGQWRFHQTRPQELGDGFNPVGLKQELIAKAALSTSAYCGEYTYMPETFNFKAEEDLTVTGIHQVGAERDVLGAQVKIGGQASYFWNMETPIEVEKGDSVQIDIYLRDDHFAEYSVSITAYVVMDYQLRGKTYGMVMPCMLHRWETAWETYLMAFEGIDVGVYHTLYMEDTSWLEELPESWLE